MSGCRLNTHPHNRHPRTITEHVKMHVTTACAGHHHSRRDRWLHRFIKLQFSRWNAQIIYNRIHSLYIKLINVDKSVTCLTLMCKNSFNYLLTEIKKIAKKIDNFVPPMIITKYYKISNWNNNNAFLGYPTLLVVLPLSFRLPRAVSNTH